MHETLEELKSMREFYLSAIESSKKNIELRQRSVEALNTAITIIEKEQIRGGKKDVSTT